MIKPGTNLCRVCGRTSHIHFYRSGEEQQGAKLVWNADKKAYALELYTGSNRSMIRNGQKSFTLQKFWEEDFPPRYISAFVDTNSIPTVLYRSCPHCTQHEVFPPTMGKVPCYVVAVIGAVSAGKTAWLGALPNALEALSGQKFRWKIEPWKLGSDEESARSTNGYENGNTNYFTIIDKKTNEAAAMLYLLDYAGELYQGQNINPETPLGRIFLGDPSDGYPGLDAVIFVEPAVSDPLNRNGSGSNEVVGVIEKYKEYLRKIPIARVCTFADKLIESENKRSAQEVPIITEKTFPRTVYSDESKKLLARHYTSEAIIRRIQFQDYIANWKIKNGIVGRKLSQLFGGSEDYYSFLVQSCTWVSEGETNTNDYRTQFNVADPLIWLLYRLRLFPLDEEGAREN